MLKSIYNFEDFNIALKLSIEKTNLKIFNLLLNNSNKYNISDYMEKLIEN